MTDQPEINKDAGIKELEAAYEKELGTAGANIAQNSASSDFDKALQALEAQLSKKEGETALLKDSAKKDLDKLKLTKEQIEQELKMIKDKEMEIQLIRQEIDKVKQFRDQKVKMDEEVQNLLKK